MSHLEMLHYNGYIVYHKLSIGEQGGGSVKKTLLSAASITALLLMIGSVIFISTLINVEQSGSGRGWVILYESIDELEQTPDVHLIVKATVTSHSVPRTIKTSTTANPPLHYRVTATEAVIEEVIRQDRNVREGDVITILEPTYAADSDHLLLPGTKEYPLHSYRKALAKRTYLFYLSWNEAQHAYEVHADYQGKYNLDGRDFRERDFEQMNAGYRSLKEAVLAKYEK